MNQAAIQPGDETGATVDDDTPIRICDPTRENVLAHTLVAERS